MVRQAHLQPAVVDLLAELLHLLRGLDALLLEQAQPQVLARVATRQVAQHIVVIVPAASGWEAGFVG